MLGIVSRQQTLTLPAYTQASSLNMYEVSAATNPCSMGEEEKASLPVMKCVFFQSYTKQIDVWQRTEHLNEVSDLLTSQSLGGDIRQVCVLGDPAQTYHTTQERSFKNKSGP